MKQTKLAMTQNFVRIATDEKKEEYLKYKTIEEEEEGFENFYVGIFRGYHGYTLSFRTKSIFDEYRVYDGEGNLILITEDEVVELPKGYNPNDEIYIEAYNRNDYKHGESLIKAIKLPKREKSDKYKLSVVVPLYNSELFMCRTIDSILSSSLDDIELILIDDGSEDKSYEIAKRYEENYSCVKAIHQENQGVSFARNLGLEMCNGEYMAFCDNDDIVHPYMYEKLYMTCKKEKTDIAIGKALIRSDIDNKERYLTCSTRDENTVIYSYEEMVENRGTKGNIFRVAVWNKIVKTEIAKLAQFPTGYTGPGILYEDVAYTGSLYSYIDRFAHCKDAIYTRDKRKQKTVGTASTWHQKEDNEYVRKMFIYGFSYPLYHKSGKHSEAHDYTHFKRLIESYDKFNTPSPLKTHWDIKLKELITSQRLNENKKIMGDKHLYEVVNKILYTNYM